MKTCNIHSEGRSGAALVTVMIVVMVMALAGASMMSMGSQQAFAVGKVMDGVRAQALAEAGANEAYAILREDFSKKDDPSAFPARQFEGGTYDATVISVGDQAATIISTGVYGRATAVVALDVQDFSEGGGDTNLPPTSPWAHSIFVNGNITHNGAGILIGSVRCNHTIKCNGAFIWGTDSHNCDVYAYTKFRANGVAVVKGTVYSPKIFVWGVDCIRNKVIGPIELVEFPTLDLTPYYQIAQDHGQVYSGRTYNGVENWGEIPGGVRWYNGNVRFNGCLAYSGAIIATGYVQFNGVVVHSRVDDLPAVISRDSYIKINGADIFHGLIYAAGDIRLNGADLLEGSFLCGGNARFNGAYGQIAYSYSVPGTGGGGGGGGGEPLVGVTCWHR